MAITCIDVSEHQGSIDWAKVKAAGVTHAILRIGFSTTQDARFSEYYQKAKAAGIKVGGYWYSYSTSVVELQAEAKACLSIVSGKSFDMPIYYDIEESSQAAMGRPALSNIIDVFCALIKKSLGSAGIYSSSSWYESYIDYSSLSSKYSIWIAQWSSSKPSKSCDIWQNSSSGYVNGISGNVDTNIIYGTFKGGTASSTGTATNNKLAWDFLVGKCGFSKQSAACCIGFWLAENGYTYGVTYNNVTPPYPSGTACPYKYLTQELFPSEVEGYYLSSYPGNSVVMGNLPDSLISYTNTYLSGYGYGGYCGIGMGSWTFKEYAGALIKYAQDHNKAWDDLDLQLNFAVATYSGSYDPYGLGMSSFWSGVYAKRGQDHGCTENNFWPGIAWFVAYEMPSYYGSVSTCQYQLGSDYEQTARNVYKEFKDTEIGDYTGFLWGGTSGGGYVSDPNDVINAEAIDALIISLDENVLNVDYEKLMDNHVSGVIFKAGSYFNDLHQVRPSYPNSNLKKQVDGAVKAGIRFGLYADVRAQSVKEAELECQQLYFVVSKYPPALGLWLHLMFTKSKSTNHKILDYYLKELQRWGFTPGCGLYCTQAELDKIDWDKYQNDFFLWYVNRFTSDSELEQLDKVLTPDFWVISGSGDT